MSLRRTALIIDPDKSFTDLLSALVEGLGLQAEVHHDGRKGMESAISGSHALILLESRFPDLNGIAILRFIRSIDIMVPVIFVSTYGETRHRIQGLAEGATDYLAKPVNFEELKLRLQIALKRTEVSDDSISTYGDLELNRLSKTVNYNSQAYELTSLEYNLLEFLMHNAEEWIPLQEIDSLLWGQEKSMNNLSIVLSDLRAKLKTEMQPSLIRIREGMVHFGTGTD